MNKHHKILFLCFFFSYAFLFAEVPRWVKAPEKEFPSEKFIRGIGEGASEKIAKTAAISDISLFFDAKVEVIGTAVKETSSLLVDDKSFFSSNKTYSELARITSVSDFFCLKFSDSYYDKKKNKYTILAYIDKAEASKLYTARIDGLMNSVNSYIYYAEKEHEPFFCIQALKKAEILGSLAQKYIQAETTIIPADITKFQNSLDRISSISWKKNELKKNMNFSVSIAQKEKKYDSVFTTISKILEKYGYAYSVTGSKYKILADISCTEENYDAGIFVRPSIDVVILNVDGTGVYSYSKVLSKTGGKTLEQAYIRSVNKINQDLEENFLSE